MDLRRAEAVDVDLRKVALDVAQQLFVPLELEFRVQSALHQDLVAAQVDRLLDFLQQHVALEHIAFRVFGLAKERAEIAHGRADVRVVDVAVDVVGAVRLGMQPARDRIGRAPSAARSWHSSSRRPSSGESRWPSTALSRSLAIVESKFDSAGGQAQMGRFLVKQFQPTLLARAQIKIQVVAQIRHALRPRQSQAAPPRARRFRPSVPAPRRGPRTSAVSRPSNSAPLEPPTWRTRTATRPSGTTRLPSPTRLRIARRRVHGPIADQQHRVGVGVVQRSVDRQRLAAAAAGHSVRAAGSASGRRWSASLRPGPACGSTRSARG